MFSSEIDIFTHRWQYELLYEKAGKFGQSAVRLPVFHHVKLITKMVHEASDWQELLDSLTKQFAKNGKLKEFYQIRNDNAKRIKFLLEDHDLRYDATGSSH